MKSCLRQANFDTKYSIPAKFNPQDGLPREIFSYSMAQFSYSTGSQLKSFSLIFLKYAFFSAKFVRFLVLNKISLVKPSRSLLPSNSARVPNGRRLKKGLKSLLPLVRSFQRKFLLVEAKHMILSVIFKINPVLGIKVIHIR